MECIGLFLSFGQLTNMQSSKLKYLTDLNAKNL